MVTMNATRSKRDLIFKKHFFKSTAVSNLKFIFKNAIFPQHIPELPSNISNMASA